MSEHIQVATNLTGPARRETFMGREHVAVSAVLVRSQVLRNNLGTTFLPAEDITPEWAAIANGRPAVVDHPRVSANSPDVLNEMGIGMVLNARVEGGALKADVFIDPGRAEDVPDLKAILAKLEDGEKVEVSTGFPVAIEETPGVVNGEEYERVIHPAGFDHLAVFAEKTGACSVSDGCGLAQNHEGPCENEEEEVVDEETEGRLTAVLNKLAKMLGGESAGEDDGGSEGDEVTPEEDEAMNREQMIARLAEEGTDRAALEKLSDCQLRALAEADNGSSEPEGGEGAGWQKAREWRRKYEELEENTANARKAEEQERAKLLDDILYAQNRAFSDEEVRDMDIVQLRKLHKTMFPPRSDYSGRGGPAANGVSSFDFVKPIMDGPSGTSVLDRKEAN